jgi:hypothetical protein
MDPGYRSPLIDLFRRGEASQDVCLLAARGMLAPRAHEQLALLVLLADDDDAEVAAQAQATIGRLPTGPLSAFLARADVPEEMREFFSQRGIEPRMPPATAEAAAEPLVDTLTDLPHVDSDEDGEDDDDGPGRVLSGLPISDRLKLAMKGTREQRAQLIRDSNKIVATAVLSSPKLTEAEVEAFVKMGNVSEDVLRIIGTNRSWLKNYGVVLGLARNPKTPPALSMQMMHRLTEKDVKMLTIDRNVPEALRLAARRMMVKAKNK